MSFSWVYFLLALGSSLYQPYVSPQQFLTPSFKSDNKVHSSLLSSTTLEDSSSEIQSTINHFHPSVTPLGWRRDCFLLKFSIFNTVASTFHGYLSGLVHLNNSSGSISNSAFQHSGPPTSSRWRMLKSKGLPAVLFRTAFAS